jgi:hypothetical protein
LKSWEKAELTGAIVRPWGGRSARHGEGKGELDGNVALCGKPDGLLEIEAKGRRERRRGEEERRGKDEEKKGEAREV